MSQIDSAVKKLYGGWGDFSGESKEFIEDLINKWNYELIYKSIQSEERKAKELLVEFEKNYPDVTKESNVNEILKMLKEKKRS